MKKETKKKVEITDEVMKKIPKKDTKEEHYTEEV